MSHVEVFCAPTQLKKRYSYTRNSCQDLSVF